MADTNETIADVISAMRDEAARADMEQDYSINDAAEMMREFAWRFEAAHKRERGDAAKLREALAPFPSLCDWLVVNASKLGISDMVAKLRERGDKARAALDAPPRNCIDKVFVLVKADVFEDETDRYKVFSSFQSANEWMRRDYISQQRKEEMADSMGVMKDDPAFFRDQPVPSSDSESAELFLGESHVVRWCIYEKELIAEGVNDADK